MPTTRSRDRDARKDTVAWRSLPTANLVEICSFLDPKALGRLEAVGRIDGLSRAWRAKADGVPRGTLEMGDKRLVATHLRMRSLYPTSVPNTFVTQSPNFDFDEFAFSLVVSYRDADGVERVSGFEYMRLISDRSEMGDYSSCGQFAMFPPAVAHGHGHNISEMLLESLNYEAETGLGLSVFASNLGLTVLLICTRKSDGTSIRLVNFEDLDDESMGFAKSDQGCLYFEFGEIFTRNAYDGLDYDMALQIYFDESTGHVRAFCPSVTGTGQALAGSYLPQEIFHALLRSRLQGAASST